MKLKWKLVLAAFVFFGAVPALADKATLTAAAPSPAPGYLGEIEEATDDHLVFWSWLDGDEETYVITEINVRGPVVSGLKNTFKSMARAMDTVQVQDQTFTFDGEMFATLIDQKIVVRVYGTAPRDVKQDALSTLDLSSLKELASGL